MQNNNDHGAKDLAKELDKLLQLSNKSNYNCNVLLAGFGKILAHSDAGTLSEKALKTIIVETMTAIQK